jgi:hypothetical protein
MGEIEFTDAQPEQVDELPPGLPVVLVDSIEEVFVAGSARTVALTRTVACNRRLREDRGTDSTHHDERIPG